MTGASPPDGAAVTEPATPVRKLTTRTITIIAAIAVLVLAGIGTTVYFLTRGDDKPAASQNDSRNGEPAADPPGTGPAGSVPAAVPPPPTGATAVEAGNARQIAEKAIKAINTHDAEALKKISCDPSALGAADGTPPEARAELISNPELTGDTATVELKLIIGDQSTTTPLPLRKQNGVWCVD
jgi:hypothetical protein